MRRGVVATQPYEEDGRDHVRRWQRAHPLADTLGAGCVAAARQRELHQVQIFGVIVFVDMHSADPYTSSPANCSST